jgi:hypothetical protein
MSLKERMQGLAPKAPAPVPESVFTAEEPKPRPSYLSERFLELKAEVQAALLTRITNPESLSRQALTD